MENTRLHPDQEWVETLKPVDDVAVLCIHSEVRSLLVAIGRFSKLFPSQNNPADKLRQYTRIIYEETFSFEKVLNEQMACLMAGAKQKRTGRM